MRTEPVKLFLTFALLVFMMSAMTMETKVKQNIELSEPEIMQLTVQPIELKLSEPIIDQEELMCLAQNIYHEARSESIQGRLAVAHVTLNRVSSPRFPNTICEVVKQAKMSKWWMETHGREVPIRNKCQFSWYCDGKSDDVTEIDAWNQSIALSISVITGQSHDPTLGSTHYYNPYKADPYWKDAFEKVVKIDNHVFLR